LLHIGVGNVKNRTFNDKNMKKSRGFSIKKGIWKRNFLINHFFRQNHTMLFIYVLKSVIVFSISRKDIHQRSDDLRKFGGGSVDN